MDSSIKQRWLAALRSGDYLQSEHALRTDTGFCCLGVLCNIYDPDAWDLQDDDGNDFTFKGRNDVLPEEVVEWADLDLQSPEIKRLNGQLTETLATLNDNGTSFIEIADLIETYL